MTLDPRLVQHIRTVARDIKRVEHRLTALERTPQGRYRSFTGSNVVYDDEGNVRTVIGQQPDGSYTIVDVNANAPQPPSPPILAAVRGMLMITWDGRSWDDSEWPSDWDRVEVHLNAIENQTPNDDNEIASFHSKSGGSIAVPLDAQEWYVTLTAVNTSGMQSIGSTEVVATPLPVDAALSDGSPPDNAPAVTAVGGIGAIFIRWTGVTNPDPVTYRVYASTNPAAVLDDYSLVHQGPETSFTLRELTQGPLDDAPPPLLYGVTYYIWVVAEDLDDIGPPSTAVAASMFQVTGDDIAADAVRANNIVGGSITGNLFSGTIVLGSTISTGTIDENPASATYGKVVGQRVQIDPAGIHVIDSTGKTLINISTDAGSSSEFEGEIRTRNLRVLGGSAFESVNNEITRDAQLKLSLGVSDPVGTPNISEVYETVTLNSTTRVTAAVSSGTSLGSFAFDVNDVTGFCWNPARNCWNVATYQNSGTRIWYFNADGSLYTQLNAIGNSVPYATDWGNWYITGICVPEAQQNVSFIGQYNNNNWHLYDAINAAHARITLANPNMDPSLSWDYITTSDRYVVGENEGPATSRLIMSLYRPIVGAPTSIVHDVRRSMGISTIGNNRPANLLRGSFDFGGTRLVAHQYNTSNRFNVMPDASAAAQNEAERWAAHSGILGFDWDGSNFYAIHTDGAIRKYTSHRWTDANDNLWVSMTWYDSDPLGTSTLPTNDGRHETKLGQKTSITLHQRTIIRVTMPTPPDRGGVDDADKWRLYMCRSNATSPADAKYTRVAEGSAAGIVDITSVPLAPATGSSTAPPPTINNFPSATPGMIVSSATRSDGTAKLQLKGDSTGRWDGLIPPGYIALYGGQATWANGLVSAGDPLGWMICDGRSLSTVLYPELFAAIGYRYDTSLNGSTTFRIPDLRGRFPIGYNPSATLYANAVGDSDLDTVINRESRMSHSHSHPISAATGGVALTAATGTGQANIARLSDFNGHAHGGATGVESALSVGQVHPYLSLNFMIKT